MKKYEELFQCFLRLLKQKYDPQNPYNNLETCCECCVRYREQLLGMVHLLKEMQLITLEQFDKERDRVIETFSTIGLFHAYLENGECFVFTDNGSSYDR